MYLLKYIAKCGICSRRKAIDLIREGRVSINGDVVTMQFTVVEDGDVVEYEGKVVRPEEFVYILLNKPKDYLTTCFDERGRRTVFELIKGATNLRVYPVGRLDRISTGLLLITNDGPLAQKLSHPSSNVKKMYRVYLDKPFRVQDFKQLDKGFELEDGFIKADDCFIGDVKDKRDVVVELHSGRNRIVRRMFSHLWYKVEKLDRIGYAGLKLGKLARGQWRFLSKSEVIKLKK